MNYTYQSFNMRGKSKVRSYYDLIANIAAEELGHIELVANTINLLLDQTEASTDGVTPLNWYTPAAPPGSTVSTWRLSCVPTARRMPLSGSSRKILFSSVRK